MDSTDSISFLSTNRGPSQASFIDKCVRSNFMYCLKKNEMEGVKVLSTVFINIVI